jgi:hypothetical protein
MIFISKSATFVAGSQDVDEMGSFPLADPQYEGKPGNTPILTRYGKVKKTSSCQALELEVDAIGF